MGLAPIANDSGRRSGRRPVRGGRKGPRSILFLIALTVARYDPPAPSGRKGKDDYSHCARPQATHHSQCKSTRCAPRVRKRNLTPQIVTHWEPTGLTSVCSSNGGNHEQPEF
ncbi:IS110 family transposase [Mesorhizobium sp. M1307]|uniref:transposase n=1 Tax=unclassified Mesorhizobium TaxID=325217 RepID=UPI003338C4A2